MAGPPLFHLIDLPLLPGETDPAKSFRIAAWAKPWRSQAVFVSPSSEGFVQRGAVSAPAVTGTLVNALAAGETGRFDLENKVTVRLRGGELSSAPDIQLFNGANTILIQCASGAWEVLQFRSAVETSADIWELTGLLRAQLGTEDAMNSGALSGAAFVALNGAVPAAGLNGNEAGMDLHWRVGPSGKDFTPQFFAEKVAAGGIRPLLPLAPVHLKKRMLANGDAEFSWVRRSRLDADNWLGSDIPLGRGAGKLSHPAVKRVRCRCPGGVVRIAAMAVDGRHAGRRRGAFPDKLELAQVSEAVGAGVPAYLAL